MVGSVNRVAAIEGPQRPAAHKPASPETAADAHGTAQEGKAGAEPDEEDAPLAPSDRLGYAKLSQISSVLTTLASARTSQRDVAAFALQEAERKLRRLKAEALAAVVSGDRKAAALIAQDLAKVAREIADAARDYAAAGGEPGITAASLAEVTAAIDMGTASGQDATSSETPQAASSAPADDAGAVAAQSHAAADDPSAAPPHPASGDAEQPRSLPEDEAYPGTRLRQGSGGQGDATFEADVRRLLDEAAASKRAMERVLHGQPVLPDATSPVIETRSALQTGLATLVTRPTAQGRVRV
ncbi:hypothetical protein [Methylobacterium pseudosasicola]|uniref:Uncharacterized protein n=1 Tax=Methylobacterium pseudosasicola TaxID=582667 RepID=A0A1I4H8C1_9HYPH|nr:hypothetical protein [Methylobacterium pseudosasicola]SFL38484.1 hypothetical protein SAMN05192568_100488 [Methylobacterium pseudosasicola]